MKFKTLAIDSGSELARLAFSWELKKHVEDIDVIRQPQNYPGSTERLNMIARRCKDLRDKGVEIVIVNHEGIDKVYAKAGKGFILKKGEDDTPAAIKGRIDIPGQAGPEEIMRAADNVFRVRIVNGNPVWIANLESIPGSDGAVWQVKDRFNAQRINGGLLPPSYSEIATQAQKLSLGWFPPYIWIPYGGVGFKKTRSLLTFPRPIKILDIDRGSDVIRQDLRLEKIDSTHYVGPDGSEVIQYNSEEMDDYLRFMTDFELTFEKEDPEITIRRIKTKLGLKA